MKTKLKTIGGREYRVLGSTTESERGRVVFQSFTVGNGKVTIENGKVRRWTIRIGDRSDRITVESPGEKPSTSHGWTWFLTKLRKHLT